MHRRNLALLLLLLLLLMPVFCPESLAKDSPTKPKSNANAAIQYWQAFALMPTLDMEQEKLLEEWNTAPLDGKAQELIAASQQSLIYLHRAAQLEHCDWGLDMSDGVGLLLPHLAKARTLSRLAALRARNHLEQRNWEAARTDLTGIMVLGRHVGRDPIMISLLVRYMIEGHVVDALAPHVASMKAPYAEARAAFEKLPRAATLEEAIQSEKTHMAGWIVRHLREAEGRKPGAGRELYEQLLKGTNASEQLKQIAVDEATRLVEGLYPFYDEMARIIQLPPDAFAKEYAEFQKRAEAANPMAKFLLPGMSGVVAKEQRNRTRFEMLLAAIAVAQHGPDALKDIRDPFGDGPFEYRKVDSGFELKSKLMLEGKPVTLMVGQEAK